MQIDNPGSLQIRPLTIEELPRVAELHMRAFPNSLLTKFSNQIIEEYYRSQTQPPNECLAVGGYIKDQIIGFCFSGVFKDSETGFLRRNLQLLLAQVFRHPRLLLDPVLLHRVWEVFHLMTLGPKNNPGRGLVREKKYGILSIAVDPGSRGLGIGKMIMQHVYQDARNKGFKEMRLSVHVDNTQAIGFYEKEGWEKIETKDGRWLGLMKKNITDRLKS